MMYDRRECLIKIDPRYLWEALGNKSDFVLLDLALHIELGLEDPFAAYHLPPCRYQYNAKELLPNKFLKFICIGSFPVIRITPLLHHQQICHRTVIWDKTYCQDPQDNPGSPSKGMRLRRGELDRVPSMNCLAIYISTRGYAKTILREITVSISYHLSSPE